MANVYLISALRSGPIIVRKIIKAAGPEVFDWKTDPGRFSFREAIAHLADWEPILLTRMQQAKNQPGSTLEAFDESERAVQGRYDATDPFQKVQEWTELRQKTADWLEKEGPDAWESAVIHPERGSQTLYDLANLTVCHDTYHIEHLIGFLP